MAHFVYILYSKKLNRFYVGETANIDQRLAFHEKPEARKFTAKAKDWEVFLKFECGSKLRACGIETHIKRMKSSIYIKNLKKYPEMVNRLLNKYKG